MLVILVLILKISHLLCQLCNLKLYSYLFSLFSF
nr:MAG TPA: hypothetical protein [Caudoviricetes sp.]